MKTGDVDIAVMFIDGGDGSTTMFFAYNATTRDGKKKFSDMGKPYCGAFLDTRIDAPFYKKKNPLYELNRHSLITLAPTSPTSVLLFNEIFWDHETQLVAAAKSNRKRFCETAGGR